MVTRGPIRHEGQFLATGSASDENFRRFQVACSALHMGDQPVLTSLEHADHDGCIRRELRMQSESNTATGAGAEHADADLIGCAAPGDAHHDLATRDFRKQPELEPGTDGPLFQNNRQGRLAVGRSRVVRPNIGLVRVISEVDP